MRMVGKLVVAGVAVFAMLQAVGPGIPAKPATAEFEAPIEVEHILEKDCNGCHSDQRRLSWFDQTAAADWLVRHNILTSREHLNNSSEAAQLATFMLGLGAAQLP